MGIVEESNYDHWSIAWQHALQFVEERGVNTERRGCEMNTLRYNRTQAPNESVHEQEREQYRPFPKKRTMYMYDVL